MEKPAATKQELLAVFAVLENRIAKLEEHLLSEGGAGPFKADPAVLAEGEYLKAQLSGVEGTESPG